MVPTRQSSALLLLLAAPVFSAQTGELKTIEEQIRIASALVEAADYDRAESLLETVIAALDRRTDPAAKRMAAGAWNDLGTAFLEGAKVLEAERAFRNSIRLWEAAGDNKHSGLAAPLENLGKAMQLRHRFSDAERYYRRGLRILEQAHGRQSPRLVGLVNALGSLRLEQNRFAEAQQFLLRGLALVDRAPLAMRLPQANLQYNLALLFRRQKRYGEAQQHLRAALAIWRRQFGPAHPTHAQGMAFLALLHADRGDFESAQPMLEDAIAIVQEKLGPAHPVVWDMLQAYSLALQAGDRKREAKAYRKRAESIADAAGTWSPRRHSVDVSEFSPGNDADARRSRRQK
ncbi:MAG: tetratricopeptide repeat protein [Bryobacteraceae bacterium]